MSDDQELTAVARFLYEAGTLKNTKRPGGGWRASRTRSPWRTTPGAPPHRSIIAQLEGADPARAAFLAVWHDSQETRTGDVNHLGKRYSKGEADPRDITADQVAGMPEGLADAIRALVGEYEAKESPEAVCARDADKLECMIQGLEYQAQGYADVQRWVDNSRGRITTKSGQALADAVLETGSLDWLRAALGETPR